MVIWQAVLPCGGTSGEQFIFQVNYWLGFIYTPQIVATWIKSYFSVATLKLGERHYVFFDKKLWNLNITDENSLDKNFLLSIMT